MRNRNYENRLSKLRIWWGRHQTKALGLSLGFMGTLTILRWMHEFQRLLLEGGPNGAIDLARRFYEVSEWFAGGPVYGGIVTAMYPPASYAILWPFLGWMDFTSIRWLWAFSTLVALVWLIVIVLRESFAETIPERIFKITHSTE